jgi:hypothetical protein
MVVSASSALNTSEARAAPVIGKPSSGQMDCDVVAIKVDDVASSGYTADRVYVRRRPVDRSDLN